MPILGSVTAYVTDYLAVAAVVESVPKLMASHRTAQKLTLTSQARQVGISSTTLSRLGSTSSLSTIVLCLRYLAKQ